MRRYGIDILSAALLCLASVCFMVGCGQNNAESDDGDNTVNVSRQSTDTMEETVTEASLPAELSQIPAEYYREADQQGTLTELEYDTYESMSYEEQDQTLHKRAIVYLPYGYDESQRYPVFYLMHGGWSDETVYLGTPDQPRRFKNMLDHGIADGKIRSGSIKIVQSKDAMQT